jgi:GT2 family glycosyltransferase
MKKLVISLVVHNGEEHLPHCLRSIASQIPRNADCVVFDNASRDASVRIVNESGVATRIIESRKNIGFAAAHNAVIRSTDSDYICILNQDLVCEPNYMNECVAFLDAHPGVGSVSGLLIRVPSLSALGPRDTVDAYGLHISPFFHVKNYRQGMRVASVIKNEEVVGVPATAAVYRKTALLDIAKRRNGNAEFFDEDFFMYKEDIDIALRLHLRGWKSYALCAPRACHVRSTRPDLFARESPSINRWSYRNHLYILIKDTPLSVWARHGIAIVLYELAKLLYLLCFERATLAALRDVWNNRKNMLEKRRRIMSDVSV